MNCVLNKFWLKRFKRNFKRFNHKDSFFKVKRIKEKIQSVLLEIFKIWDFSLMRSETHWRWEWVHSYMMLWKIIDPSMNSLLTTGGMAEWLKALVCYTNIHFWCIMGSNPISSDIIIPQNHFIVIIFIHFFLNSKFSGV